MNSDSILLPDNQSRIFSAEYSENITVTGAQGLYGTPDTVFMLDDNQKNLVMLESIHCVYYNRSDIPATEGSVILTLQSTQSEAMKANIATLSNNGEIEIPLNMNSPFIENINLKVLGIGFKSYYIKLDTAVTNQPFYWNFLFKFRPLV